MNREIKFRGYSKNYKQMFLNDTWQNASDGLVKASNQYFKEHHIDSIPIERGIFIPTKDSDLILMQYTGINDDKGTEIYESDIIRRTSMSPGGIDIVGVVEYLEGSWWVTTCDKAEFLFCESDKLEIIGNKYESQ